MTDIINGLLIALFLYALPTLYRLRQESKWRKVEHTWEYLNARMEELNYPKFDLTHKPTSPLFKPSYDYLMSMRLYTLTRERVEELLKTCKDKQDELAELRVKLLVIYGLKISMNLHVYITNCMLPAKKRKRQQLPKLKNVK